MNVGEHISSVETNTAVQTKTVLNKLRRHKNWGKPSFISIPVLPAMLVVRLVTVQATRNTARPVRVIHRELLQHTRHLHLRQQSVTIRVEKLLDFVRACCVSGFSNVLERNTLQAGTGPRIRVFIFQSVRLRQRTTRGAARTVDKTGNGATKRMANTRRWGGGGERMSGAYRPSSRSLQNKLPTHKGAIACCCCGGSTNASASIFTSPWPCLDQFPPRKHGMTPHDRGTFLHTVCTWNIIDTCSCRESSTQRHRNLMRSATVHESPPDSAKHWNTRRARGSGRRCPTEDSHSFTPKAKIRYATREVAE